MFFFFPIFFESCATSLYNSSQSLVHLRKEINWLLTLISFIVAHLISHCFSFCFIFQKYSVRGPLLNHSCRKSVPFALKYL